MLNTDNVYLSSVPPSIDGPAEESVVETISNPVTFACDATGIPPPSLAWLKNGRPIGTPALRFKWALLKTQTKKNSFVTC